MTQEAVKEMDNDPIIPGVNDPEPELDIVDNEVDEESDEQEQGSDEGDHEPNESDDARTSDDKSEEVDYEAQARAQGWAPKENWKGDPDDWVDAKTFIERGNKWLPNVRKKVDRLDQENSLLKEELKAVKKIAKIQENMAEDAKRAALEELMQQQKDALLDDDNDRYKEIESKKAEVIKRYEPEEEMEESEAEQASQEPEIPQEVNAWVQRNEWFRNDQKLRTYATAVHDEIQKESPHLSLEQNLEEVTKEVQNRFPEKFGNPRRNQAPRVNGVARVPGKSGVRKGWNDIPDSDRKQAVSLMGNALKTDTQKREYAKQYWELDS